MDRRKAIQNTGIVAGATLMAPALLSLLQSCKTEPRLDWQPLFLDNEQAQFMSSFVDAILPKTETPGALDVKVDLFLDKVFAKTYDAEAKQKLSSDISQFNEECKTKYGDTFANLNAADKVSMLEFAESQSAQFNRGVWGTAIGIQKPVGFYRSLKSMAIWAYFSSEEIGKQVLNYDPIPQEFVACKPVTEVGNRWTL